MRAEWGFIMTNQSLLKVNWIIYLVALVAGIAFVAVSFFDLAQPPSTPEDAQSRFDLSYDSSLFIFLLLILSLAGIIVYFRERIAPYHVPTLLIFTGALFQWIYFFFTTGWVGFAGTFIFAVSVIIALGMALFNFVVKK